MAKGLPKSIIKKYGITKKAWSVFRGRSKSRVSRRKTTKRKKTNPKRRKTNLARRKRRRRSNKMTIPLAPVIGIIAAPAIGNAIKYAMQGNVDATIGNLKQLVGVTDGGFNVKILMDNVTPIVIGLLVHKFVGGAPLNLNRVLASSGVPFIRI